MTGLSTAEERKVSTVGSSALEVSLPFLARSLLHIPYVSILSPHVPKILSHTRLCLP